MSPVLPTPDDPRLFAGVTLFLLGVLLFLSATVNYPDCQTLALASGRVHLDPDLTVDYGYQCARYENAVAVFQTLVATSVGLIVGGVALAWSRGGGTDPESEA